MKKLFLTLVVLGLTLILASPALCCGQKDYARDEYGYGWGHGHMMDRGHHGWGMHGHSRRWHEKPHGWESMKPEQKEQWEEMRSGYLMETLELRKQLTAKQMELETLWAQPDVDRAKVEKLSNEVAELKAKLAKKRDQYLMHCRQKFGNQGWACPGGWW